MSNTAIEQILAGAARVWLETNGDPFPDGSYKSTGNPFLVLAETAFLDVLETWRQESHR